MHSKPILLAATLAALLAPAAVLRAQSVVFSQPFSGGATSGSYVGTGANQFDAIIPDPGFWTAPAGALLGNRTGANGNGAIIRTTPITGLPAASAATFAFDFAVTAATGATSGQNDVIFQVGNGFTTTSTGAETAAIYTQFTVDITGTNAFSVNGTAFTGTQRLTLAVNNTGSTVNITAPGGGTLALQNDNFTIFVGNTNILAGFGGQIGIATIGSGNPNLDPTQFKLRFASEVATISVDNFTITTYPVPEPSTVALAGLGLVAAVRAVRRRR